MKKIILALFVAFLISGSNVKAATFQNGSFEIGPRDDMSFQTLYKGDTSIPGWIISDGNIDYKKDYWTPSSGIYSLDMSGYNAGTISQTFDTNIGQLYKVTFDLAGNSANSPKVKTLQVTIADKSIDFSFDTNGHSNQNMGWVKKEFFFKSNSTSNTLTFKSLDDTLWGPALDNVNVAPVPTPEPSSLVLGLMGIGSLFGFRRKLVA